MISDTEKSFRVTYEQYGQNLRGKAVVIIGDAAGVGLATAVKLAENGAPVFLAARNVAELKRALAAINQAGGEGDGMVADMSRADQCRRFFTLAEGWLGRIDAVVNPLPSGEWQEAWSPEMGSNEMKSSNTKMAAHGLVLACQNLCTEEAVQHMRAHGGQIININLCGYTRSENSPEQRSAAELRRQAKEQGVRVTVIEPGGARRGVVHEALSVEDIARCVVDSLSQPFGVDMIVLPGQLQLA